METCEALVSPLQFKEIALFDQISPTGTGRLKHLQGQKVYQMKLKDDDEVSTSESVRGVIWLEDQEISTA